MYRNEIHWGELKPYRDGIRLLALLRDGWARGFESSQTLHESHLMGFTQVTTDLILRVWRHEDAKFERWVQREAYHSAGRYVVFPKREPRR